MNRRSAGWIGIDIGASSVKLLSLSRQGRELQVDAYAIVPLPTTAVVDGSVAVVSEVAVAIERGLKICGGKYSDAIVAVPSSAVITKRLQISNLFTGLDLEDQVKVEADQFIPYPLEEVALDFEVLGPSERDRNLNDILLVACRKESAEAREEAVNDSGIKCGVIDVDTYAMERLINLLEPDYKGYVAVADVGSATLSLNVFHQGQVVYNREQAFTGNELSYSIQQQYGMTLDEVELALREQGLAQDIHQTIVQPFADTVIQQVSRALQFYYSSGVHGQLDRLYLSGGLASISGLVERVGLETEVNTLLINPFVQMRVNPRLNQARLLRDAPLLAKACGLALRSFDQ
ncbi:type IV pilus assembly protein PilM [Nitrincola tapanii]|nr:type IV pilus assembly protein PilM [Nitrincola tapanii]